MNWEPLLLSFKLSIVTTILLFIVCLPLAALLAYRRFYGKIWVDAILSLPLVLPPTVIGFYLLLAFSPGYGLGQWMDETLGLSLVFSFPGLVLGSMIYSLPFMVHPLRAGFTSVSSKLLEEAQVLGKSKWQTFYRIIIPQSRMAILSACILCFAHTLGEFGVVLMIGGNIPDKTRVASIAIYDAVEAMNYQLANQYAIILVICSLCILGFIFFLNRKDHKSLGV